MAMLGGGNRESQEPEDPIPTFGNLQEIYDFAFIIALYYGQTFEHKLWITNNKADRPANSRECWAGALMEVRSLFGLNSASCDLRSAVGGQTKQVIESLVCD